MLVDMSQVVDAFKIPLKGVFHVGAHYGQEVDVYEKLGINDIIMFEPSKKNFDVLKTRVGSKATLVNLGLGSKHEFVDLNVEENNQGMSNSILTPKLHKEQYPHIRFTSSEKIEVTTLDEWVSEDLGHNVLVMDVQGYEFEVLLGATKTLQNIDLIITEVNRAELYENCSFITEMDVFLRFYGFRRVVTNWEGRTWGDAIYVRESFVTGAGYTSQKILIADTRFSHSKAVLGFDSASLLPTSRFDWCRDLTMLNQNSTLVVTDDMIKNFSNISCSKIAWLIEPAAIDRQPYIDAFENQDTYSAILSHDKEFVKAVKNGVYYPCGGSWISPNDWKMFDKNNLVSIIVSNKKTTRGQQLRHEAAELISKEDRFGSAFKKIDNKIEALKNYKFSISIENELIAGFFTEKIIDCFLTGTVPIYWGCPGIEEIFDMNGIIKFESIEELKTILSDEKYLNNFYEDRIDAIKSNSKKARRYASVDENFFNAIIGVS